MAKTVKIKAGESKGVSFEEMAAEIGTEGFEPFGVNGGSIHGIASLFSGVSDTEKEKMRVDKDLTEGLKRVLTAFDKVFKEQQREFLQSEELAEFGAHFSDFEEWKAAQTPDKFDTQLNFGARFNLPYIWREAESYKQLKGLASLTLKEYLAIDKDTGKSPFAIATDKLFAAVEKIASEHAEFLKSEELVEFGSHFSDFEEWRDTELTQAQPSFLNSSLSGLLPSLGKYVEDYKTSNGITELSLFDYLAVDETTGKCALDLAVETLERNLKEIGADITALGKRVSTLLETPTTPEVIDLSSMRAMLPQYFIMQNTQVGNNINALLQAGEQGLDIPITKETAKKEITTFAIATGGDDVTLKGRAYTGYDAAINDTIASLWEYGNPNHIVTDAMIYRAMVHKSGSKSPSKQQLAAVNRSIEKQRRIEATIDATDEIEALAKRKGQELAPGTQVEWGKFLLVLTPIRAKCGKEKITAYRIDEPPILHIYAAATNKRIRIPADLLDIRELNASGEITENSISNTEMRIAAKNYLLKRIEIMRYSKEHTDSMQRTEKARAAKEGREPKELQPQQKPTIKFETLFSEIEATTKDSKTDMRKYVFQCLDFWKAKGHIKGYTKRQTWQQISAVDIEL